VQLFHQIHHIAIICSDYSASKKFYTEVLGFEIISEVYRAERHSYKLDLALNGVYTIELFSFPNPPERPSRPEAAGLRHIAFATDNIENAVSLLAKKNIIAEPIRTDEYTGKRFTFIADPDGLPIELYENSSMNHIKNQEIAQAWFDAFNRHHLEDLLSLYDDNAEHFSPKLKIRQPETEGLIKGKSALRTWWQDSFERLPELHYSVTNLVADDKSVFMEYIRKVPGEDDIRVAEILEINERGLIKFSRVYHG